MKDRREVTEQNHHNKVSKVMNPVIDKFTGRIKEIGS